MKREIWKPVVGFKGLYEVSNLGRVRSVDRVGISFWRGRNIHRKLHGKILSPWIGSKGYLSVVIANDDKIRIIRKVHSLVLEAFIGPRPEGYECRHLDDVPDNNRLSNLCWGTNSENVFDAIRNGKRHLGEILQHSKLTAKAVRFIRKNAKTRSANSLAQQFGVACKTITQVIKNTTWKHVE